MRHCCESNHILLANQRSDCVTNCKHVEFITSAIIMHLLAGFAWAQAQNSSGSLGSCVAECMFVQNVQQWAQWGWCSVKKVHEQLQGFLGPPDLHLGLSHHEEWNIVCRKQTNKKRLIVQAVTVILNSEMRSSHLPLLSLCQCCHRDKGKQRKGMCVIQKPISHVCSFNRSAAEARHFQTQQFYTKQELSNIHPHVISSCDGCSPSRTLTSVLHRCSHGLHAACCQ